jgi:heme/copper-type cytochrome/quinol oxidase subunit 2
MPIVVDARPKAEFAAWLKATAAEQKQAAAAPGAAPTAAAPVTPAATPTATAPASRAAAVGAGAP